MLFFADVEEEGEAGGVAGFAGFGVAEAVGFGDVGGAAEEDLAFGLAVGDEDAAEADVGDDDAMGEVVDVEGDGAGGAVAIYFEHGGDHSAGGDSELEGFERLSSGFG